MATDKSKTADDKDASKATVGTFSAAQGAALISGEFTTAEAATEVLPLPGGGTHTVDPTMGSTTPKAADVLAAPKDGKPSDKPVLGKTGAGWWRFASGTSVRIDNIEYSEVPRVRGAGISTLLRLHLKSGQTLDVTDTDPEGLRSQIEAVRL